MSDLHTFRQRQRLHLTQRRAMYVLTHTAKHKPPSRAGLLVACGVCILVALTAFYFLIEATLPPGLPR